MRSFLIAIVLLFLALPTSAQWMRMDTNADLPQPFTPAGLTYDGEYLYTLSFQGPPVVVKLFRSPDMGQTWQEMSAFPNIGGAPDVFMMIDGTLVVSDLVGSGAFVSLLTSTDQGASWNTNELTGIGRPVGYARQGSSWFAVSSLGVSRSSDGGQTWSLLPDSPLSSSIIATESAVLVQGLTGTFISSDGGQTWSAVSIDGSLNLFSGKWVWNGSFFLKSTVFATIYRSDDNGASWQSMDAFSDFGFTSVLAWEDSQTWVPFAVASGAANFYTSTDLAASASPIGLDGYPQMSPGSPCFAVPTITEEYVFVAASLCFNNENGIYRYNYATGTAVDEPVVPSEIQIGVPYPNPTVGQVTLPITLEKAAPTSWRVLDLLGREIVASGETLFTPGSHEIDLNLTGYPAGLYLVDVRTGHVSKTRQIAIMR